MLIWLFNFFKALVLVTLPLYLDELVVLGRKNVPKKGPTIIIGNHPNMLLDALIIGATCGRPVSYWAKSTLFHGKPGKLLRALGALPVRRRMDDSAKSGSQMDNRELQQETYNGFFEGRAMCVFPEGTSHSEPHMMHLKDGVSWVLFEFYDKYDGKLEIPVIPCGITYVNKNKWRSQAVVIYGKPIILTKEKLEEYRQDKKKAVKHLTEEFENVLLSLTLNADDWETMKLAHTCRRIYMSDTPMSVAEYVEVTRRFTDFYAKFKDDVEVQALKKEIAEYQDRLDSLRLKDSHVRRGNIKWALGQLIIKVFFVIVLWPLVLPGVLINLPIMAVGHFMNVLTPYREQQATMKYMSGLLVGPTAYLLIAIIISYIFSWSFLVCLVGLAAVGMVNVWILEEELIGLRSIGPFLRLISVIFKNKQRAELKQLKTLRDKLEKQITAMVDKHATPEQRSLESIATEAHSSLSPLRRPLDLKRRASFSEAFI